MANIDWIKIKNEYISTNISQRKLADKYDISFNTLRKKANKESWAELKKNQYNKITTKLQQKTADKIADKESDRISRMNKTADKLLEKIEEATEQLNNHLVKNKRKTKVIEYNNSQRPDKPTKEIIDEFEEAEFIEGDIDRTGLKMVVGALKDLSDIIKGDTSQNSSDEEKQEGLLKAIEEAVIGGDK